MFSFSSAGTSMEFEHPQQLGVHHGLFPLEPPTPRPIPRGTKVRFRWDDGHPDEEEAVERQRMRPKRPPKTAAAASSLGQGSAAARHSLPFHSGVGSSGGGGGNSRGGGGPVAHHHRRQGQSIIGIYRPTASSPSSHSLLLEEQMPSAAAAAGSGGLEQNQLMDSQLVAFRGRTSALDRSSSTSAHPLLAQSSWGSELLSGGILVLSLAGFLLLFVLGFCLFRMFKREEEEALEAATGGNRRTNRELQIVLVPKERQNRSPSLVHPQADGSSGLEKAASSTGGKQQQKQQQQQLNQQQLKPFPRRIYEIQAEEGYYSCPPSMRASFEID